jgi:hypothetical protein
MCTIEARDEDGLPKPEEPHLGPMRWDLQRLAKAGSEEDLPLAEQGLADWADALDAEDLV